MSEKLSIDAVIPIAMSITSAVTEAECKALWNYVSALENKPNVLEIGSYLGRSGSVIGLATQQLGGFLYMVDPFYETDIEECRRNVNNAGVRSYEIIRERSELAGDRIPDYLSFIFDDGDHQELGVMQDCDIYIPKLRPNAIIAFHDYESSWVDVKKVVNSRQDIVIESIVDSIAFCRKK